MESYLAEDKERERERGILSWCKGSPPSAPCLPRGHVDVDVDMARLGPFSSLLIACRGAPELHEALSLTRFWLWVLHAVFWHWFPRTLWAVYYDVDVARCHRQFSVSSVLPWNMQSAVKKLFICINQTEFFHSFFQFLTFSGGERETDCIIKSQQRLFRHFHDNYRFGNGFTKSVSSWGLKSFPFLSHARSFSLLLSTCSSSWQISWAIKLECAIKLKISPSITKLYSTQCKSVCVRHIKRP